MTAKTIGRDVVLIALAVAALPATAQDPPPKVLPDDATEEFFIQNIRRIAEFTDRPIEEQGEFKHQVAADQAIFLYVDELLERYPKTAYRQEALIAKLGAAARLARTNPAFLQELMLLTEEISRSDVKGKLASENAYYAIQAFVFGARFEGMPEERRRTGVIERYRAFLEDYPESSRAPAIHASLIRALLAANHKDLARAELAKLQKRYANHGATRRAKGEVDLAAALGRPFVRKLSTSGGESIDPKDYRGRILVIHFWSSRSQDSEDILRQLTRLYEEYHRKGLEIVSIAVGDHTMPSARESESPETPWLHLTEPRGFHSDLIIDNGITGLPTCLIIDRKGVLHSAGPAKAAPGAVERLLAGGP